MIGTTFAQQLQVAVNKKEERLSKMILNYLRKHPNAGDTLEGITRWWLELERIDVTIDDVADALRKLKESGIISCYETSEGLMHYRINGE